MIKFVDNFLNKITMYRLVLYVLIIFACVGLLFSWLGILPYNPLFLVIEILFVLIFSVILNKIFSLVFNTPTNVESVYITSLILVFLISPPQNIGDMSYWIFLFWVAVWSVASKYILAINKKHIFNPAALAVVITAFTINQYASWWIGTITMVPFVLVGGLLIVRKIKRFDMVITFIVATLAFTLLSHSFGIQNSLKLLYITLFNTPLFFFAFIMLTEPLTTPPNKYLQILYGAVCGLLFSSFFNIGPIFFTPELSLVVSNIFSYIVSPKEKYILRLKNQIKVAKNTYDFVFSVPHPVNFNPGKYMEWTLEPKKADSRGNRRYFTIASSPTENELRMGVKFYPESSTFKQNLLSMNMGDTIMVGGIAGDFTLPKNKNKKLVFMAGGIGITPFRSMIKYLIDKKEKRDIILLYSNKTKEDVAYKEIFDEAREKLDIKTIFVFTDEKTLTESWQVKLGSIDQNMITQEVKDYKERYFYLSGPHNMVTAFDEILQKIEVKKNHIKKDYFPGFA
jgi:ferredoxin-NADP reductase